MTFEKDKASKLKRLLWLRIMYYLGMIRFVEGKYSCAEQKLRMLHPLSWIWTITLIIVYVFIGGIPAVVKDFKYVMRNEMVWW